MTPFAPTIGRKASSLFLALILTLAAAICLPTRALAIESLPSANESDLTDGTVNGTNWMSYISGERYLNEMTIPGTHDASMCKPVALKSGIASVLNSAQKTARTQDLSLSEQLDVGVRVFDLRLTNHSPYKRRGAPDGVNTYLCHGPWNGEYVISSTYFATTDEKTAISFSMAMGYYTEFLRQHPTETVLLSVNNEYGAGEPADVLALARAELDKWAATTNPSTGKPYIYMPDGNKLIDAMPKLSDTRGQIVVLAPKRNLLGYGIAFDTDKGWTSGAQTANVRLAYENHYEATNEDKVDYVTAFYNGGTVEGETIDAQKGTISPTIQSTPLDYVCFVNTSSNRLLKVGWLPRAIAEYVNPRLFTNDDALLKTRGVYYGWVNVDFVTDKIAQCIWLNNFPEGGLKYSSVSFRPGGGAGEPTQYAVQQGTTITLPDNMFTPGDQNNASFVGWTVNGKLMQPGESVTADTEIVEIVATWGATWNDLQQAILQAPDNQETTITLTTDVVAQRGDQTLVVPKGKRIVIEMNGHAIDKRSASLNASGGVFDVDGKLTLRYGTVTGGKAERGGGILVDSEGRVTLTSVTVTGNTAQSCGGGVYVTTHPEVTKDALGVDGATTISGNKLEGSGADSNVWLARDTIIYGVQNLSEDASIGVATEAQPTSTSPVVISSNLGNDSTAESHLVSESDYYIAQVDGTAHGNNEHYAAMMAPFQVTFDSKGGTAVKTQQVKKGERATKPANPLLDMKYFTGWYIQGTNTAYDFTQPVTKNLTLEARWKTTTVSVTFDSDGGSEVAAQAVDFGKTATRPADPTREGYQFVCWKAKYESSTMGHTSTTWVTYNFNTPVITPTALKATWEPASCTVSFDVNGGDGTVASQTIDYGERASKPTAPTRDGYAFLGWYEEDTQTPFNFNEAVKGDVSLTARWQAVAHVVTFDGNGGTPAASSLNVTHGQTVARPSDPTREGYVFTRWNLDGSSYAFETPVTSDITLTAIWTKVCTVSFETLGGSPVSPITTLEGSKIAAPADPTRTGYIFRGWYTDAAHLDNSNYWWNFASNAIYRDRTLYAKWEAETHTVTFDSQGGSEVASQTVAYGKTVSRDGIEPTYGDKIFAGWFTNPACTVYYDLSSPVTHDTQLYAKWVDRLIDTHTVTFDSNGGTAVDPQQVKDGEKADEPTAPTRTGHTFGGWYADAQLANSYDFTNAVTDDLKLYAKWTVDTHTVSFDLNYDGATGAPAAQTVTHGTAAAAPDAPVRDGYVFAGWCSDAAGTTAYDFSAAVTGDVALYATWSKLHAVTFDANDGSAPSIIHVEAGSPATTPADPTRKGHSFGGWYLAGAADPYDFAAPVSGDMTLFAKWAVDTHTVTFDSQGGSNVDSQTVAYGSRLSQEGAVPTREGHVFKGWYTDSDCTQYFSFSTPVTEDLGLYAGWAEKVASAYTVSFDSGEGSYVAPQLVTENGQATAPTDPVRKGYEFSGWHAKDSSGAYVANAFDFASAITSDITLYALWEAKSFNVTFVYGNGTDNGTQAVGYGDTITVPDSPEWDGHSFLGWYTKDDSGAYAESAFDFSTAVTADVTLYARWAELHTVTFALGYGGSISTLKVADGKVAAEPDDPQRAGYTFTGWFLGDETTSYAFSTPVTSDITLTARWTVNTYKATFETNGGSIVAAQEGIAYGSMVTRPEDPTRAGYIFDGWFADTELASAYDFATAVSSDVTLYARWAEDSPTIHTVTFDSAGGTAVDTQWVTDGDKAARPVSPTRDGYAFAGWYEENATSEFDFEGTSVTNNIALTARWTSSASTTCNVTFDPNYTGATSTQLSVPHGSAVDKPEDPAREGHVFAGWCTDAACTTTYDFATPVTGDLTLYASWTDRPATHLVVFESNGGTAVETQQVLDGGMVVKPSSPTRDGYTFAGWYDTAACVNEYAFYTPVVSDLRLYAKWTADASFSVTFNSNGGSSVAAQSVKRGEQATRPTDPMRTNYQFEGWYVTSDGTLYDFAQPVLANVDLTAQWSHLPCTVSFDSNGGSNVASQTDVPYGGFATKPADPTQDGCTFDGWYLDLMTTKPTDSDWDAMREGLLDIQNDPSLNTWLWVDGDVTAGYTLRCSFDFASDAIEEDVTLHARWQTQTHTVAFDANAGGDTSVAGMPANQTSIEHGTTATEPGTYPTRDHYLCTGWYIDEDCADTDLFDFATPITNDLTLYAGWQAKTYAVTFDAGGGSPVDEQTVAYNEKATKPTSDPTREGYEFAGWYADAGLTTQFDFASAIVQDTVIHAKWEAKSYDVEFKTFGGSPVPDTQTVAYNNHATKPSTDPTLEGHTFAGWYARVSDEPLSADLISEIRSDAQLSQYCWIDDAGYLYPPFDFATDAILADTTLYARWTPDSCTISFDATGGTPTPDDQQLSYNSLITKPADPTREGYVLDGWYFQLSDETLDDKTADEIRNDAELSREYWVTDDNKLRVAFDFEHYTAWDSMTLYARWAPRANTATFVDGEGNVVAKQTVLSGEAPISIEGTGEFGYDFLGWYADESRTTPYDFAAPISSDVTIYGAWEPQTLTVSFDSNGGSEIDPKTQLVAYEEYASRPEDPKRAGYTFLGWYEDLSDELSADELDEYKAYLAEILSDEDPDLRAEALEMLDARYTVVDGKVMSYYEPEFDPVTYDLEVQALWQEGYVTSEVVVGDGAPQVTASNLDAVARALATDEEVGLGMHVTLKITALSEADVSDQDKALLEARAKELGITVDQWLDISLYKSVAGGEPVQIHELPTPLIIHLTVPTNLQATGDDVTRTFYLLRSHDGQASVLAKGAEATLSGATDRLSTHLLGHLDVKAAKNAVGGTDSTTGTTGATGTSSSQAVTRGGNPQTGDTSISVAPLLALGALFLTSGIIVRRLLRKE